MAAKALMPGMKGGALRDFSGGPNLRDSETKLAANELEDAFNVTFDERGDASSRLGYSKWGTPYPDPIVNEFWSQLTGQLIVQAGTKLYLDDPATSTQTFSTDDIVTFAETNSLIVANHPADGLYTSSDAVTWTAVADLDAPDDGLCIAVWQNKLFVGRPNGSLHWSAAGDPTTWDPNDFVDLWEKDQDAIVALHVGSGQDIQGRPGLLCFKQESFYRVNDSTTGSYTTVDATVGAAGPKAVIGVGARICFIGKHGVYWWREGLTEVVNASDRLLPLWDPAQLNLGKLTQWAAGRKHNRALFSLTRSGSTANDLALELHPDQEWLAPRSDAMTCYATSTGDSETLYGGSPTVAGQVYELESGGSDDGAAIDWRLQTRWVELNGGFKASVWQMRMHGRGTGTVTIRTDYASAGGKERPFDLTQSLVEYDTGLDYDAGYDYASPAFQTTQAFRSIGVCRQISFIFSGSSTTTEDGPQVLGQGTAPVVGAFGLAGLEWLYTELGLS